MKDRDNQTRSAAIKERVFPDGPDNKLLEAWIGSSRNATILEINPAGSQLTIPLAVPMKNGRVYTLTNEVTVAENILAKATAEKIERLKVTVADITKLNVSGAGRLNSFINGQKLNAIVLWDGFDTIPVDYQANIVRNLGDRLKPYGQLVIKSTFETQDFSEVAERLQGFATAARLDVSAMARIKRSTGETVALKATKPAR